MLTHPSHTSTTPQVKSYLYLFVRDDMMSWNTSKRLVLNNADQRAREQALRKKIMANVNTILKRTQVRACYRHVCVCVCVTGGVLYGYVGRVLMCAYSPTHSLTLQVLLIRHSPEAKKAKLENSGAQMYLPLDNEVHKLIDVATDKNELCLMNPIWIPWF
jgi:phosphatidylinositol kinase/protein kinase (PI-3  family)